MVTPPYNGTELIIIAMFFKIIMVNDGLALRRP